VSRSLPKRRPTVCCHAARCQCCDANFLPDSGVNVFAFVEFSSEQEACAALDAEVRESQQEVECERC